MIDTTITIGNLSIHEPVTAFTDFLITILAFFFYLRLSSPNETVNNWRRFFLFISLSTLMGGCSHAFFAVHDGWAYKSLWLPMQFLNGFAVYFAQRATLISVLKDSASKNVWRISYSIQLILYFVILGIVQKYIVTIADNAIGLIPIMVLHFGAKDKEEYYRYIGYGICISFITAIVHGLKISIGPYFNFNDIAHVFIMISLTVMFLGIKQKATS
jgi:hypothetical protein